MARVTLDACFSRARSEPATSLSRNSRDRFENRPVQIDERATCGEWIEGQTPPVQVARVVRTHPSAKTPSDRRGAPGPPLVL